MHKPNFKAFEESTNPWNLSDLNHAVICQTYCRCVVYTLTYLYIHVCQTLGETTVLYGLNAAPAETGSKCKQVTGSRQKKREQNGKMPFFSQHPRSRRCNLQIVYMLSHSHFFFFCASSNTENKPNGVFVSFSWCKNTKTSDEFSFTSI